jgi:hypothetical protein
MMLAGTYLDRGWRDTAANWSMLEALPNERLVSATCWCHGW